MKKKKLIAIHATAKEYADFLFIQEKLERSSEAETLRAMISMVKKILSSNIDISTNVNPIVSDISAEQSPLITVNKGPAK